VAMNVCISLAISSDGADYGRRCLPLIAIIYRDLFDTRKENLAIDPMHFIPPIPSGKFPSPDPDPGSATAQIYHSTNQ